MCLSFDTSPFSLYLLKTPKTVNYPLLTTILTNQSLVKQIYYILN